MHPNVGVAERGNEECRYRVEANRNSPKQKEPSESNAMVSDRSRLLMTFDLSPGESAGPPFAWPAVEGLSFAAGCEIPDKGGETHQDQRAYPAEGTGKRKGVTIGL